MTRYHTPSSKVLPSEAHHVTDGVNNSLCQAVIILFKGKNHSSFHVPQYTDQVLYRTEPWYIAVINSISPDVAVT
jgi:hypothetical protein